MTELAVERLPPEAAFDVLSHELRFDILAALNDADEPLSFSDLREVVGARDSGRFNYHLGKLTGRFVRESEEGYHLARTGKRVLGAVLSGGYTHVHDAEPVSMTAPCPNCSADMEARFDDETVAIACSSCDLVYTKPDVPPGVLDGWDRSDVPQVIHRWTRRLLQTSDLGICPYCDGRMDTGVYQPGDPGAPEWFEPERTEREAVALYRCRRCGHQWHAMVPFAATANPAVIAFHHDHGIDLRQTPGWRLEWTQEARSNVIGDDPLRLEVPITIDAETRVFVFDDQMALRSERSE